MFNRTLPFTAMAVALTLVGCTSSSTEPEDEVPFDVTLRNSSDDDVSLIGEGEDHAEWNILQPGEVRTYVVRSATRGQQFFFFAAWPGNFGLFGPDSEFLPVSTRFCTHNGPSGERKEVVYIGGATMNCQGW